MWDNFKKAVISFNIFIFKDGPLRNNMFKFFYKKDYQINYINVFCFKVFMFFTFYYNPFPWSLFHLISLDTLFTIFGDQNSWFFYEEQNLYIDLLKCVKLGVSPHPEFTNLNINLENETFTNNCKDPYLSYMFERLLKKDPTLYSSVENYTSNMDSFFKKPTKEGELVNYVAVYQIDETFFIEKKVKMLKPPSSEI